MSKNHPHDNIYSILGKLAALEPTTQEKHDAQVQQIRESVEAQGSILKGLREVSSTEAKLRKEFAESEKWIQKTGVAKHKGDLHKALHVPQGEKIPKGKIEKASHSKDAHLRHMAQFAKNVAHEGMEEQNMGPGTGGMEEALSPEQSNLHDAKSKEAFIKTCRSQGMSDEQIKRKLARWAKTPGLEHMKGMEEDYGSMGIGGMGGGGVVGEESVDEVAAPGQEDWIKKNKQHFIDQYGKDKGLSVLYATAWKRHHEANESAETCNECGMFESECSCDHTNEAAEPTEKVGSIIKRVLGQNLIWKPNFSKLYKNTRRSRTQRVDGYVMKDIKVNVKIRKGNDKLSANQGDQLAVDLKNELVQAGYPVHSDVIIFPNQIMFQTRTPITVTGEQAVAEGVTDDPAFQRMMGKVTNQDRNHILKVVNDYCKEVGYGVDDFAYDDIDILATERLGGMDLEELADIIGFVDPIDDAENNPHSKWAGNVIKRDDPDTWPGNRGVAEDSDYDVKDTGYSKIYQRKVKDTDIDADDEDDTPKVKKGKGRPTKASKGEVTSQGRMPWGGKPPKTDANPTKKWPKEKTTVHKIKESISQVARRLTEGVNFAELLKEKHKTVDEMLSELSNDIKVFKSGGPCSELLRDCMDIKGYHGKMVADEGHEAGSSLPAAQIPGKQDLLKTPVTGWEKAKSVARDTVKGMMGHKDVQTYEEADPLEAELNELAKLAGVKVADEGNAFTGKLKGTAKGDEFELDGKTYKDTSSLDEGSMKELMWRDAERMSREQFCEKYGEENGDFWDNIMGGLDEAYGDTDVEEIIEPANNAHRAEYQSMKASTMNPGEGDFGEKNNYDGLGDNKMKQQPNRPAKPVKQISLEAKLAAEYESIKKVS